MVGTPNMFGLGIPNRLAGVGSDTNRTLLDEINARGDMFLIHTELQGKHTIRCVCVCVCAHVHVDVDVCE